MAMANFGRPIGAAIAALTLTGDPRRLTYAIAAIMALAAVATVFLGKRRPSPDLERQLAHGAGAAPVEN